MIHADASALLGGITQAPDPPLFPSSPLIGSGVHLIKGGIKND